MFQWLAYAWQCRVLLPVTHSSPAPIAPAPIAPAPIAPAPSATMSVYKSLSAAPAPAGQQTAYKSLSRVQLAALSLASGQTPVATTVQWMELDSSNAAKYAATQNNNILTSALPNQWHQVIVKTPTTNKAAVVNAINKRISPLKLIPYFFGTEDGHMTFFVNNCAMALKTLCQRDLKVPYNVGDFDMIELVLRLCAKTFNLSETLQKIVSSRLDPEKKNLDLSYLTKVPMIHEMLFDPLDISPILEPMLRVAEVLAPSIVSLNLAGNNLVSLVTLKNFFASTTKISTWKTLRILDLSHNKILTTGGLFVSQKTRITELYLDDNPICAKYKRDTYINVMKANFPGLIKLDGTYLQTISNIPSWKPNYIATSTHGDSGEIADQFLEHFYTLYDGDNRTLLRGLYNEEAYFSIASMYMGGQTTSSKARLTRYLSASRNLLRISDMRKERANLIFGEERIIDTLSNLPRTQHDPHTFTVDVTQHTEKYVVLTVTGVFKERSNAEKTSPRHFMRTFILVKLQDNEFKIVNDMMFVSNATSKQNEEAFTFSRPPKKIRKKRAQKPEMSEIEKESMVDIVSQLTDMTALWARKCLDDCDWDMKEALEVFLELYKVQKIPKAAFVNPKLQTGRA